MLLARDLFGDREPETVVRHVGVAAAGRAGGIDEAAREIAVEDPRQDPGSNAGADRSALKTCLKHEFGLVRKALQARGDGA